MEEKTLEYIAGLARLYLPEEEKADLLEQMRKILNYMDQLDRVDTSAAEPLIQFDGVCNVIRADEENPFPDRERLLRNAKKLLDGAYQVPRTVE